MHEVYDIEARRTSGSHRLARGYGSQHATIKRLTCAGRLTGHRGCVNTVAYSSSGESIVTGSDDLKLKIYHGESLQLRGTVVSGHMNNVFAARLLPGTDQIASAAADGQIRLNFVESAAGTSKCIARHAQMAHRLVLHPGDPARFYSCGEDGKIFAFDTRTAGKQEMFEIHDPYEQTASLYALAVHPLQPHLMYTGGGSADLLVLDTRMCSSRQSVLAGNSANCAGFCEIHYQKVSSTSILFNWLS